jgi:hypothetical protein
VGLRIIGHGIGERARFMEVTLTAPPDPTGNPED